MNFLSSRDPEVDKIILRELDRQTSTVELIASENFVSPAVMEASGSVLTNKYAEGYPGKRYYGGCEFVDEVENLARERAKKLFRVPYVNVQPHSGSQANMSVLLSMLSPGDKILGLDLSHGGHLTHGSTVNFSGKVFQSFSYGVERDTGYIDMNEVASLAEKVKPQLIICGGSAYSRDWDYQAFREIANRVGALLFADIAHPAGLIATGLLKNPLLHCHVVTSTTHKTLRGPRGGIILMGEDFENPKGITIKTNKGSRVKLMSEVLDSGVMPGVQGGPLMHIIAAKAVAFKENLSDEFKAYAKQVCLNAKAMSEVFSSLDYKIISGGTDNHLMLIDLRNKNVSGKKAESILHLSGITTNKNVVPFDDKSAFITSGIRIGTPAITTRGMKEDEARTIARLIDKVISHINESNISSICKDVGMEVSELMKQFLLYTDLPCYTKS